jgi:hypothetical protein
LKQYIEARQAGKTTSIYLLNHMVHLLISATRPVSKVRPAVVYPGVVGSTPVQSRIASAAAGCFDPLAAAPASGREIGWVFHTTNFIIYAVPLLFAINRSFKQSDREFTIKEFSHPAGKWPGTSFQRKLLCSVLCCHRIVCFLHRPSIYNNR